MKDTQYDWKQVRTMHDTFKRAAEAQLVVLSGLRERAQKRLGVLKHTNPSRLSPRRYRALVDEAGGAAVDVVLRVGAIQAAVLGADAAMQWLPAPAAVKVLKNSDRVLKRYSVKKGQ